MVRTGGAVYSVMEWVNGEFQASVRAVSVFPNGFFLFFLLIFSVFSPLVRRRASSSIPPTPRNIAHSIPVKKQWICFFAVENEITCYFKIKGRFSSPIYAPRPFQFDISSLRRSLHWVAKHSKSRLQQPDSAYGLCWFIKCGITVTVSYKCWILHSSRSNIRSSWFRL